MCFNSRLEDSIFFFFGFTLGLEWNISISSFTDDHFYKAANEPHIWTSYVLDVTYEQFHSRQ